MCKVIITNWNELYIIGKVLPSKVELYNISLECPSEDAMCNRSYQFSNSCVPTLWVNSDDFDVCYQGHDFQHVLACYSLKSYGQNRFYK